MLARVSAYESFKKLPSSTYNGLPFLTVEGCFGARKQDIKIFLSFNQAKTGQLDKQQTCFGQRQCA
jgi:hypothetical protein